MLLFVALNGCRTSDYVSCLRAGILASSFRLHASCFIVFNHRLDVTFSLDGVAPKPDLP